MIGASLEIVKRCSTVFVPSIFLPFSFSLFLIASSKADSEDIRQCLPSIPEQSVGAQKPEHLSIGSHKTCLRVRALYERYDIHSTYDKQQGQCSGPCRLKYTDNRLSGTRLHSECGSTPNNSPLTPAPPSSPLFCFGRLLFKRIFLLLPALPLYCSSLFRLVPYFYLFCLRELFTLRQCPWFSRSALP